MAERRELWVQLARPVSQQRALRASPRQARRAWRAHLQRQPVLQRAREQQVSVHRRPPEEQPEQRPAQVARLQPEPQSEQQEELPAKAQASRERQAFPEAQAFPAQLTQAHPPLANPLPNPPPGELPEQTRAQAYRPVVQTAAYPLDRWSSVGEELPRHTRCEGQ